jgi:hypothetical protein
LRLSLVSERARPTTQFFLRGFVFHLRRFTKRALHRVNYIAGLRPGYNDEDVLFFIPIPLAPDHEITVRIRVHCDRLLLRNDDAIFVSPVKLVSHVELPQNVDG